MFATGGVSDAFFQRQLAPYVDTAGATWGFYKPDGTVEPADSLQTFQRAQIIRDALFTDGGRTLGTRLEFRLLEMDSGVGSMALDVDGQVLGRLLDGPCQRQQLHPLKSASHSNPVRLTALEQFQCPQRL